MDNKKMLNILNGQAMYNVFNNRYFEVDNVYVPFNEAMCEGKAGEEIFSEKFIEYRCRAHNITIEQYNETTLKPLKKLFEEQFSNVVLWFDDDMFCQINLLTILAYLEQINYSKRAIFNLVDRDFKVIERYELNVDGYNEIYKKVMIEKQMPQIVNPVVMEKGIELYLQYLKDDNEILSFIRENIELGNEVLIVELLQRFQKYGLGDAQYMKLINRVRENN